MTKFTVTIPTHVTHQTSQDELTESPNMIIDQTSTANRPVFDPQRLAEFTGGDPDLDAKLKTVFIDNLTIDIQNLEKIFAQHNYEEWDACVHKIYGSSSHIGAAKMAELCDKGQSLYPDATDKISDLHELIMAEYRYIHEQLKDYMTKEEIS